MEFLKKVEKYHMTLTDIIDEKNEKIKNIQDELNENNEEHEESIKQFEEEEEEYKLSIKQRENRIKTLREKCINKNKQINYLLIFIIISNLFTISSNLFGFYNVCNILYKSIVLPIYYLNILFHIYQIWM